jgi:hypothetical protein
MVIWFLGPTVLFWRMENVNEKVSIASLSHVLNISTYLRSSNSEAALRYFVLNSISSLSLDHFHFWKDLFTNKWAEEKAFAFHGH